MDIIKNQYITPLLTGNNIDEKRAELKCYFRNTWATYESLFSLINTDNAYFLRPEPLRHPLIFYFGHTATFFINKLILGKYINKRINKRLEAICAVGVDEMSWDDLNSDHYDWPSVKEVQNYRQEVSVLIENLIDNMPLTLPIQQDSLAWVILMGIEHERIHIETSSVIMRMLDLSYLTGDLEVYQQWQACPNSAPAPQNELVVIKGKVVQLGKPSTDATYGWDNEYGKQNLKVEDFSTSKYLVSNQEFLIFIEAGGYSTVEYWNKEGQEWLQFTQATMPKFWFKQNDEYFQRNLTSTTPLPLNWPVEVNYLEAKAFCNWKSQQSENNIRLLTEAEWFCLRENITSDVTTWQSAPANINLEYFASSCPVNLFENNGIYDIAGNVWQWSESEIDGFNGFSVHPLYDDFSTPTFDGKHNLLKGGSWISTGNEALKNSRYAFRRHFTQHAGFRYVSSEYNKLSVAPVNQYETDCDVCQQLESHYGSTVYGQKNYQQQVAELALEYIKQFQVETKKLLDLGCSVGRSAFELAANFDEVDAIDFSARYIQYGVQLQNSCSVRYVTEKEGEIIDFNEIDLAQLDLPIVNNILFSQGDPSNLKAIFTGYDVILAQQVLEKNHHPKLFLTNVDQRLNKNGLFFLLSDYAFNEKITTKENWLGGLKVNGENVTGFAGVEEILNPKFEFLAQHELSKILKNNARYCSVYQIHLTIWRKKL